MKLEELRLKNFRCFGPDETIIRMDQNLTVLVGGNGSGKTAVFVALSRLFGINSHQRSITKRDFHLATDNPELTPDRSLILEAVFCFPELDANHEEDNCDAVPEFFRQMAASAPGEPLKVRMRLKAVWTDDGTPDGSVTEDIRWITALDDQFNWDGCQRVQSAERASIQVIYVPAARDADSQVARLLKGRLWKAARWSQRFRDIVARSADNVKQAFTQESPAEFVLQRLSKRWTQLHMADTETDLTMHLVESRFESLVRNATFTFSPDEAGAERTLEELSDGQRSLFHIALTATTLEVEQDILQGPGDNRIFEHERLRRVHLTLLAIEEPENSLSPFFLSRIIRLARDVAGLPIAQVAMSSHSPAILGRIEPEEIRYFRLNQRTRQSTVKEIDLPNDNEEASHRYVRLAVKAYPELYFARFVILGEGDSECLVIHRIAQAMKIDLDPSFVPIVPLGGRYAAHFWRLLETLGIPFATLLDLDLGRRHGGANLVRQKVTRLRELGHQFNEPDEREVEMLEDRTILTDWENNGLKRTLENEGVFFSHPLDIDFSMLRAFQIAYAHPHPNGQGPRTENDAIQQKKATILKHDGNVELYNNDFDDCFAWYPYLFLNKSKPETHIAALSRIDDQRLESHAPAEIKALLLQVKGKLWPEEVDE